MLRKHFMFESRGLYAQDRATTVCGFLEWKYMKGQFAEWIYWDLSNSRLKEALKKWRKLQTRVLSSIKAQHSIDWKDDKTLFWYAFIYLSLSCECCNTFLSNFFVFANLRRAESIRRVSFETVILLYFSLLSWLSDWYTMLHVLLALTALFSCASNEMAFTLIIQSC